MNVSTLLFSSMKFADDLVSPHIHAAIYSAFIGIQ